MIALLSLSQADFAAAQVQEVEVSPEAVEQINKQAETDAEKAAAAQRAAEVREARKQAAAINRLRDAVIDPQLPVNDRIDAGRQLLAMPSDRATAVVRKLLADDQPDVRSMMLRAIATSPDEPGDDLAMQLMQQLTSEDAERQPLVARALARSSASWITQQLADTSLDAAADLSVRQPAISALAYRRTQIAAGALMKLIDQNQPAPVQAAAYDALRRLTGRYDLGNEPKPWATWWAPLAEAPQAVWQAHLIDQLADEQNRLMSARVSLEERVVALNRQLYRSATEEQRPDQLVRMLADPVPAVRMAAVSLVEGRIVDGLAINDTLRTAIRNRLADDAAAMRERSALLLRDLADEAAADRVAAQLASGLEDDPVVLRAYLRLISRMPRAEAVPFALDALLDPSLRNEPAGALAAAADKKLLTERQQTIAIERVRARLEDGNLPSPDVVSLLGRIGNETDWKLIAKWLDSPNDGVKEAAASAWARSTRSLRPLAERATDPVIGFIAIHAARDRGKDPLTLLALVANQPASEQAAGVWRSAIAEMAGRVPGATVLEANAMLMQREGTAELRRRMLSAAVDKALSQHAENAPKPESAEPPAQDQPAAQSPEDTQSAEESRTPQESQPATDDAATDDDESNASATSSESNETAESTDSADSPEEPEALAPKDVPVDPAAVPEGDDLPVVDVELPGTEATAGDAEVVLIELMLAQAQARMDAADPQTALTGLRKLDELELPLSDPQRRMRHRILASASLLVGEVQTARAASRWLMVNGRLPGDPLPLPDDIINGFIALGEREIEAARPARALAAADAIASLARSQLTDAQKARIKKVRDDAAPPPETTNGQNGEASAAPAPSPGVVVSSGNGTAVTVNGSQPRLTPMPPPVAPLIDATQPDQAATPAAVGSTPQQAASGEPAPDESGETGTQPAAPTPGRPEADQSAG